MKVYISSRLRYRPRARELREVLEAEGITVTSTWIDTTKADEATPIEIAERDARDLRRANVMVILGHNGRNGGLMCELGIALERGLRIIHIAAEREPDEVFLWLDAVEHVRSIPEALDLLVKRKALVAA